MGDLENQVRDRGRREGGGRGEGRGRGRKGREREGEERIWKITGTHVHVMYRIPTSESFL